MCYTPGFSERGKTTAFGQMMLGHLESTHTYSQTLLLILADWADAHGPLSQKSLQRLNFTEAVLNTQTVRRPPAEKLQRRNQSARAS